MRSRPHPPPVAVALLLALPALAAAQAPAQAGKRALTHADYDSWRTIQGQQLSRDGKFLVYFLVPQDGDAEFVARNLGTGKEWRFNAGSRPTPAGDAEGAPAAGTTPAPAAPTAPRGGRPGGGFGGARAQISADGRFVAFLFQPTKKETADARAARKKLEEMPRGGVGLMDLSTGQV